MGPGTQEINISYSYSTELYKFAVFAGQNWGFANYIWSVQYFVNDSSLKQQKQILLFLFQYPEVARLA